MPDTSARATKVIPSRQTSANRKTEIPHRTNAMSNFQFSQDGSDTRGTRPVTSAPRERQGRKPLRTGARKQAIHYGPAEDRRAACLSLYRDIGHRANCRRPLFASASGNARLISFSQQVACAIADTEHYMRLCRPALDETSQRLGVSLWLSVRRRHWPPAPCTLCALPRRSPADGA
jgi:hypothetical protein